MLFLFDYDGVIVDSFDQLLDLCVRAQGSLGVGRSPTAEDFRTIERLDFKSIAGAIGIPEEMAADYAKRVFALQEENWSVKLFEGIAEAFRALAERDTLAVITASHTEPVEATLRDLGIASTISSVMGGERGKSKAERIAIAMEKYSHSPSDTFMIGDAISDVREGKRAGVKTVAVSWGFQDRELLAGERPDFLVDDPADLLKIRRDDDR